MSLKSSVFLVTKVSPYSKAVAAIIRSNARDFTRLFWLFKVSRNRAHRSATAKEKGRISTVSIKAENFSLRMFKMKAEKPEKYRAEAPLKMLEKLAEIAARERAEREARGSG
jgi:hypothetical protein